MIVVAPVYQPSDRLLDFIDGLSDMEIVVVDDGSDRSATAVLAEAAKRATVLRHPANRGKGAALKTAFGHVAVTRAGHGVVCADADGQHSPADVRRVAGHTETTGRTALGVRRFDGEVPLRSRIGNVASRLLFRAATGHRVQDTQTGLRAYPADLIAWARSVPGESYDYEMNLLLYAARAGHPLDEVVIATTYLDEKGSSHFGSLTDSVRVYRPLLQAAAAGLLTTRP